MGRQSIDFAYLCIFLYDFSVPRWSLQSGVGSNEAWCRPYQQWAILKPDCIWLLGWFELQFSGRVSLGIALCIVIHSSALTDGAGLPLLHQSMQKQNRKTHITVWDAKRSFWPTHFEEWRSLCSHIFTETLWRTCFSVILASAPNVDFQMTLQGKNGNHPFVADLLLWALMMVACSRGNQSSFCFNGYKDPQRLLD